VRRRVIASGLADGIEIEVVHPGVDLALMTPGEAMEPFFLVPGRIMWTKNIELAIAAFKEFRRLGVHDSIRLVIAGMVDNKSQAHLAELRLLADGLPVEFVLSPSDEELFKLYSRCQAVVFPPPNEDWGLVPLEAMAFARPVIAIDRGGPQETVTDGVTGILCDDNGPESMTKAMCTLAETDVALMMGRAGRERVAQFEWSKFVERIDSFAEDFTGLPAQASSALDVGSARTS
jgi:glycosyltransferase involved in cell wall biosynthesis